jgi:hypothetical protein
MDRLKIRDLAIVGTIVGSVLAGGSVHAASGFAQATLMHTAGAPGDTYTWSANRPVWSVASGLTSGGSSSCAAISMSNYTTILSGYCTNVVWLHNAMKANFFTLCTNTSPIVSSGGIASSLAVCSVTDSFKRNGAPFATLTLTSWSEFHGTP